MDIVYFYNELIKKLNENIFESKHWSELHIDPSYIKTDLDNIRMEIIKQNNVSDDELEKLKEM